MICTITFLKHEKFYQTGLILGRPILELRYFFENIKFIPQTTYQDTPSNMLRNERVMAKYSRDMIGSRLYGFYIFIFIKVNTN